MSTASVRFSFKTLVLSVVLQDIFVLFDPLSLTYCVFYINESNVRDSNQNRGNVLEKVEEGSLPSQAPKEWIPTLDVRFEKGRPLKANKA